MAPCALTACVANGPGPRPRLPAAARPPKVVTRDEESGYSGIHLLLLDGAIPVEVQIHTAAEHVYWRWSHDSSYKNDTLDDAQRHAVDVFGVHYARYLDCLDRGLVTAGPIGPSSVPKKYSPHTQGFP